MKIGILRTVCILTLGMSIQGWITLFLSHDSTTWIDAEGILHEPLFWLIPVSFSLLFIAIISAALEAILKYKKRH